MNARDRLLAKVAKESEGCWLWTARIEPNGYGKFFYRGAMRYAHRVAYELFVGTIPDGQQLDHLCRVRHCVNPDHLEPVSHAANVRRGVAGESNRRRLLARTRCARGHEYTPENTGIRPDGARRCRRCDAERARAYRSAA